MRWLKDVVAVVLGALCPLAAFLVVAAPIHAIRLLEVSEAARARSDFRVLAQALRLYQREKGKLPGDDGLEALVRSGVMEALPLDPWGHDYSYDRRSGLIRLASLGKDGRKGGEELTADIECWLPDVEPVSDLSPRCDGFR